MVFTPLNGMEYDMETKEKNKKKSQRERERERRYRSFMGFLGMHLYT